MSFTSKRVSQQAREIEQDKKVYCMRCLKELFCLSTEDMNNLISADPGVCPRCEGDGPLFLK
jgi:hypothetical protein